MHGWAIKGQDVKLNPLVISPEEKKFWAGRVGLNYLIWTRSVLRVIVTSSAERCRC
ncbi:hypothetical protein PICMEDRAFT_14575, partial [Pichia membranifaciens NRRL Y-2026]